MSCAVIQDDIPLWRSLPGCNLASANRRATSVIAVAPLVGRLTCSAKVFVCRSVKVLAAMNNFVLSDASSYWFGVLGFADKNGVGQKFVDEIIENRSAPSGQQPFVAKPELDHVENAIIAPDSVALALEAVGGQFSGKTAGNGSVPLELPGWEDGLIPGKLNDREVRPLLLTASKAVVFLLGLYLGVFIKKHCFASWRT